MELAPASSTQHTVTCGEKTPSPQEGWSGHFIYGKTLEELRVKEKDITKKTVNGLNPAGRFKTLNDLYEIWTEVKRGLKNNTFENYKYTYEMYVKSSLGKMKIDIIKKTDVKRFYNTMVDQRGLSYSVLEISSPNRYLLEPTEWPKG